MVPTKAYIMHTNHEISLEYREDTFWSCVKNNIQPEYFKGWEIGSVDNVKRYTIQDNKSDEDQLRLWFHISKILGFDIEVKHLMHLPAACCTANHFLLWDKIFRKKECAIILEHDALMLHPVTLDIPDGEIVCLGYKVHDTSKYNHISAGQSKTIRRMSNVAGSHAYTITPNTAELLLHGLQTNGVLEAIDNYYFLRDKSFESDIPVSITDPISALAWVRNSTIWDTADCRNYFMIDSFTENYTG
jgi:GR25 family glycosyltransferase involved in LPS biosynthesis